MFNRYIAPLLIIVFTFKSLSVYAEEAKVLLAKPAKKIERIIALAPHSVELLFTLGAGDMLVGTSEFADYPEAAKAVPRVGGYNGIQLERVLELQPDLIIAWDGGNNPGDIDQMERLGLPVYRSHSKKLSDIAEELKVMGRLIGMEKAGVDAAKNFTDRLGNLKTKHSGKSPVTFFYQLWANPLKGMSEGSWINEVLAICGGKNVLTDKANHYPSVSMENILVLTPEAIVQPSQHGTDQWNAIDWTQWPEIPAVKNKHIFPVNGDLLHRFSVRILDGMEVVCDRFDQVRKQRQTL
ncbi:MAG: cobalamin-binding protein [Cellvibrionaceae bacterium]